MINHLIIILLIALLGTSSASAQDTWRGLVVEVESRCTPYDKKKQYPYPASVENHIVRQMDGKIYGPYTGRYFQSIKETDIEHIVAASEGHDSGLCRASDETRKEFATDLLNLTLAAPKINRCYGKGKCGYDAAEWLPERNQCWFANRIVEIKTKYQLSVNLDEARTLETILSNCDSTEMIFYPKNSNTPSIATVETSPASDDYDPLSLYDSNRNGRITCAEARSHGITPVTRNHPAYQFMNDRNGDGVVCD